MIVWLLTAAAVAGSVAEGAEAFDAGRLDEAIQIWDDGAAERPSGTILFDLGNAWYRKGDLPRAIAHYRAAQQRRPRDGDVHHNLALARSELGPVPPPVLSLRVWMSVLTVTELALIGALITALGSLLMVRSRFGRGRSAARLVGGVVAWLLGLLLVGVAVAGTFAVRAQPVAVIVEGETLVRDAASVAASERHRLKAGTEVRVQRGYGGFLLVEDSMGRRGWIAEGTAVVR